MTQEPYYTTLSSRGLIKIAGTDRRSFLQGLITNDIALLDTKPCIYACLLSPQGKFLFDFFITEQDDVLLLECEGNERTTELAKMLKMYALRAEVTFEVTETVPVYVGFGGQHGEKDPRHNDMGWRSFVKPENLEERRFDVWDTHRITLCIPDGSRDLIPGKSTMDEGQMDQLNAISYDKGCYVGQELTARMHYRGLGKKHLQTVQLNALPYKAELRSSCGDLGIALVRATP